MRQLHLRTSVFGALLLTGLGLAACSSEAPAVIDGPGGSGGDGGAGGMAAACPETQTMCGDVCVSTDSDAAHCGACDNACAAGESCNAGVCELACPAGQQTCGGACVDLDVDGQHCGACDAACDAGQVCNGAGSCALTCQAGLVDCNGKCIDPLNDRAYCGAGADCTADAGTACADGEICNGAGSCELSCQAGLVDCGGTCIDPLIDRDNCGAGADCTTTPGTACAGGELCNGAGSCELSCQAGRVDCGGACIDPLTDRANCGAGMDCTTTPGTACADGEICNGAGSCELSCQAGLVECDGRCVNPDTNIFYCGASGTCQAASAGNTCNVGEVCAGGSCTTDKIVFMSSQTHGSDFGGIPGADEFCQQLADAAGLPGVYYAWLSDDFLSPATRFVQSNSPYVLVDGTKVADDWADLIDGTLDSPINKTEYGDTPPQSSIGTCSSRNTFWTNTSRAGNSFANTSDCTDWSGVSENGATWGRWDVADFLWTEYCGGGSCAWVATVACFQQ